jgi:uncharacterized protein (TIGR00661 family)
MRILYGVPSEGMGHAARTKPVVAHLLKNHDVRIVTSDRALKFLGAALPGRVEAIRGFHLAYKNARVQRFKSFYQILQNSPRDLFFNLREYRTIHDGFAPELVISDFESFSFFYAHFHKLPIISVDNMQVIDRCALEFDIPRAERENYLLAKNIIKAKVPGCDHYFITTFFYPPVKKKDTSLVPCLLRDEVLAARPVTGEHVLVYQTSQSQGNLVNTLRQVPRQRFVVYGLNRNEEQGNVRLKTFSEEGFIQDLAAARAVVTNGGFTLISEAVYFKKPVCVIPLANQFEQYVNGAYIQKLGYGRMFPALTADNLKAFLYELDDFAQTVAGYSQDGNRMFFGKLDAELARLGDSHKTM